MFISLKKIKQLKLRNYNLNLILYNYLLKMKNHITLII